MNQLRMYSQTCPKKIECKKVTLTDTSTKLSETPDKSEFHARDKNQRLERKSGTHCSSVGFPNQFHLVEFCHTKKNPDSMEKERERSQFN